MQGSLKLEENRGVGANLGHWLGANQCLGNSSKHTTLDDKHVRFLSEFEQRHGRRPAVLHIGNIGNNAYILAKALNAVGVDSDVLCYDYYHTMGCPEWEESDYVGDIRDQFYPAWEEVDLCGFRRPPWFAQGPLLSCLRYLLARRTGNEDIIQQSWRDLERERNNICSAARMELPGSPRGPKRSLAVRILRRLCRMAGRYGRALANPSFEKDAASRFEQLRRAFQAAFPDREDALTTSDLAHVTGHLARWHQVLQHYDLVMGYSTDGVYALVAGRPYFAFEHGTIRSIPFESTPTGRLCALTYRMANHAFITNADNHLAAQKLGLENFSFLPHPLNEAANAVPEGAEALRADIRRQLGAEMVILHPSRQHWTSERHPNWEKGNDALIEGFARFVHEVCPRAGAVFVNWGQTVEASRALLAKLGVADRVLWIEPQSNRRLLAYIKATDALADQFYLGAFGGTMPKALMLGRPNLIYLDESRHKWCLPEMPPVLNVRTPDEVLAGLTRLYRDPGFAHDLAAEGERWYRKYHSIDVVVGRFLDAMSATVV